MPAAISSPCVDRPARSGRLVACALLLALLLFASRAPSRGDDNYWSLDGDGFWDIAANWSLGTPTSSEDVFDDIGVTITHRGGNDTVNSFTSIGSLLITGGSLSVTSTISVQNTFQLSGGGLANGTILATSGALSVDGNGGNYISGLTDNSGLNVGAGFVRVYNGGSNLNGMSSFAGGQMTLNDGNAALTIGSTGLLHGYGTVNQSNGGATLTINGTVNADVSAQPFNFALSNLTLGAGGIITASSSGVFQLTGGALIGQGGSINTPDPMSVVVDNGAGVTGTFNGSGAAGLQFLNNGSNYISGAVFNGNVTVPYGGFVRVYNGGSAFNGTATFVNGLMTFNDGNAALTVGSTSLLHGYGTVNQSNGGATLTINGTVNADSAGNAFNFALSNLTLGAGGIVTASNTGMFQLTGGALIGQGGSINTPDSMSVVADNGGGVTGTFNGSGAAGLQFLNNGSNYISNATFNGAISVPSGGFVRAYNGGNNLNGTSTFSGGQMTLNDGNATVTVGSTGLMCGYGTVNQSNGGATLAVNGTINADSAGNAFNFAVSSLNLGMSGIITASNTGMFQLTGGQLNGSGGSINTPDPLSVVADNGGGASGTFNGSGAAGLQFLNNGSNYINGATFNGNVTVPNNGFVQVYNGGNNFNGTATFANGLMTLNDGNASLTVGSAGLMHGYGTVNQSNSNATLTDNGTINADANAQTFSFAVSNLILGANGIITASNTGMFQLTGGALIGQGGSINTPDSMSVVADNGGAVTGVVNGSGAAGLQFLSSGNNNINGATFNGDITVPSGGFVRAYNGGNNLNATSTFSGGQMTLNDGNAVVTVGSTGLMCGYGTVNQSNGGATLAVNGTINADSAGNAFNFAVSNLNLNMSGIITASNTGMFQLLGGQLNGSGGSINTPDPLSVVADNGGGASGTFNGSGAAGLQFLNNGSNYISNATFNGNITVPSGGFVRAYNGGNNLNGTSTFSGGQMTLNDGNATVTVGSNGMLHGYGTVNQSNGGASVVNNGVISADTAAAMLAFAVNNLTNNGTLQAVNDSTLAISASVPVNNNVVSVEAGSVISSVGGLVQTAGTTRVNGLLSANGGSGLVNIEAGSLTGSGTAQGSVSNAGSVSPGNANTPGKLTITGAYAQTSAGVYDVELGGYAQGTQYSLLAIGSNAALGGQVDVSLVNGFEPYVGDTFDILTYGTSRNGTTFNSLLSLNPLFQYSLAYIDSSDLVRLTVTQSPVPGPESVVVMGMGLLGGRVYLRRRRR